MNDRLIGTFSRRGTAVGHIGDVKAVSGGTKDYNKLTNKPTLNGVEIIGDKTSEDYQLAPPMWFGTRAEYNALPVVYPDICYFIEEGT